MKIFNVLKYVAVVISVLFFVVIGFIVSPVVTHKPKEYLELNYEEYIDLSLKGKPHILPETANAIKVYVIKDNRPGRMLFYIFHEAQIGGLSEKIAYIQEQCMKSVVDDKKVKLYEKMDGKFEMENFLKVFDKRFIPQWWSDDGLKMYDHNRLTAFNNSGYWLFYNINNRSIKVVQWYDSKEEISQIDREMFDNTIMGGFIDTVKTGDVERAKEIINSNPVKVFVDKDGRTPIHYAVELKDKEFVAFLISNGIDKDAKDNDEITPIYLAVASSNMEMVEFLISEQVNVNSITAEGLTPLYTSVVNDDKIIENLLIGGGADLQSEVGYTPLHAVAGKGVTGMAEFWLKKGAKINSNINPTGDTPLHNAVAAKKIEMIKFLIRNGADTTFMNRLGQTPIDLAKKNGYPEVAKMIRGIVREL